MKLVVAIDGQASANSALAHILKYPPQTQVHLVHVIVPGFAETSVAGIPDVVADEKNEEQGVLSDMVRLLKESAGIEATSEIVSGETAEVIAEVCRRLDA